MAKISGMLISMVVVSMILGGIILFMGNLSDNYSVSYSNGTLTNITTELQEINTIAAEGWNKTNEIKTTTGILDIVGDIFESGYTAFKITFKSFSVMEKIIRVGGMELKVSQIFITGFITIILLIIIAVALYAIFKVKV